MAAGRLSQQPGEWFQAVVPDASLIRFDATSVDLDLPLDGRQLVVIARDAHRHAWERDAIEALTSRAPDAIVIEIGASTLAAACRGDVRRNPRSGPGESSNRPPRRYTPARDAGWSSLVARRAHNPEVAGSNPAPATGKAPETGLFRLHRNRGNAVRFSLVLLIACARSWP